MSLYRKYRPQNFDSLVGQDHIRDTLVNALKLERVSHAYLFAGPRGTGKTSVARILAKAVNCTNLKDATPCEQCEICNDINDGRLIDVIEIDGASNRGIDEIRDLKEKINFSPTRARNKVYIIDEVHMLTKEAFNALLKTLEEPPPHVFFILATTEVHKIPETILSRCQRFDFKRISDPVIVERLKFIAGAEKVEAEVQALEVIAHIAQGGMRDAIGLFEQLTTDGKLAYQHVSSALGLSGFASLEKLYGFLVQKESKTALDEIHNLYMEGYDLTQFNKGFLEFLRKKLLQSVEQGRHGETSWLLKLIDLFQQAYDSARFAVIPQLPLEMAVIESCIDEQKESAAVPVSEKRDSAPAARDHKGIKPVSTEQPVKTEQPPKPELSAKADSTEAKDETEMPAGGKIDFDTVKAKWPRILEKIKTPLVKRSFSEASLGGVDGHTIRLTFGAKFHYDKMMETANRVELEEACSRIFGLSIKITGEISKPASGIGSEEQELAEKVAEMFEGKVS